jgi:hypothetical protein
MLVKKLRVTLLIGMECSNGLKDLAWEVSSLCGWQKVTALINTI